MDVYNIDESFIPNRTVNFIVELLAAAHFQSFMIEIIHVTWLADWDADR